MKRVGIFIMAYEAVRTLIARHCLICDHQGPQEWKSMGRKFGDIQARVLLTLFYFVILTPFVLAVRRNDPLAIKDGAPGGWRLKGEGNGAPMQRAKRQY